MTMNGAACAAGPEIAAWSADVFAGRRVPPARTVLGPLLRRSAVTLLTGPRGVGKSWLALALAHAASRGGALAGWRAHKAQRVVYVDAGSGEALLQERLAALAPVQPPSLVVVPGDAQAHGLPDVADAAGREALDRLVTDVDLVVLDGIGALVQAGRGVGSRWAALAQWLRSLRRRGLAVLLVETSEPRALAALADTVLRLERPADATAEPGLRMTVRVNAARTEDMERCFGLHLAFRDSGAVWTRRDAVDHRALTAWRMHQRGHSTRAIGRVLDVSSVSAWRLVKRGKALPEHLRKGEELPELEAERRQKEAHDRAEARRKARRRARLVALEQQASIAARTDPHPTLSRKRERVPEAHGSGSFSRLREKAGDEGGAAAAVPEAKGDAIANFPEAVKQAPAAVEPADSPEAVKQPPASLDDVATDEMLAVFLARRRCWRRNLPPPPDRLAKFAYDALALALRARLTQRILNRKMLDDDTGGAKPPSRAEQLWRTPQHLLPYDRGVA
ncbi:MAG: hypothetical protein K0R40_2135 [Burkholderiales bacterium]|nr:hypothetical protein [Burkholderiales bacterium]